MQLDEVSAALEYREEAIPLPATVAGIMRLLRKILGRKHIAFVSMHADQPIQVGWHRTLHDAPLLKDVSEDVETTLARVEVDEIEVQGSAVEILVDAMHHLAGKQLVATHIVVSDRKRICDFFGLPWTVELPKAEQTDYRVFAGLFVEESLTVSEDSFVILGAPTHGPDLTAATTAVRLVP
jgi:hypothetical protein